MSLEDLRGLKRMMSLRALMTEMSLRSLLQDCMVKGVSLKR